MQRYPFDATHCQPEESVLEYMAELRKLAQDYKFGDTANF